MKTTAKKLTQPNVRYNITIEHDNGTTLPNTSGVWLEFATPEQRNYFMIALGLETAEQQAEYTPTRQVNLQFYL